MNDLTTAQLQRQNILNNRFALQAAEQHLQLGGVAFQGNTVFTKQQVMALFEVSDATVERYVSNHGEELKANGYQLLRGKILNEFKDLVGGTLMNEGIKTSILGVFSFRAVLNLAMLLTESERAKAVRSRLLDIVMDVLAERTGGHTKYINQRDEHYLTATFRAELPQAIHRCAGPLCGGTPVEIRALYQPDLPVHLPRERHGIPQGTEACGQGEHSGDDVFRGADADCQL